MDLKTTSSYPALPASLLLLLLLLLTTHYVDQPSSHDTLTHHHHTPFSPLHHHFSIHFSILLSHAAPSESEDSSKQQAADETPLSAGLSQLTDAIQKTANLPEVSEKALLRGVGDTLVSSGLWKCNPFGGQGDCMAVPPASHFASVCERANLFVDCAFQAEAFDDLKEDPQEVLRKRLVQTGYLPCPSCLDSLHRFWCAQTVPTCGTFDKVLDEILPYIAGLSSSPSPSSPAPPSSADDVIASAIPHLLAALALGQPCHEMCLEVTAACGCGKTATFGKIMSALLKHGPAPTPLSPLLTGMNMTLESSRRLFKYVWNTPICDLFVPENFPGFEGLCVTAKGEAKGEGEEGRKEEGAAGVERCEWCREGRKAPAEMEEEIAAQIAQAMSAMMQSGLRQVLDSALTAKEKRQESAEKEEGIWSWFGRGGGKKEKEKEKEEDEDREEEEEEEEEEGEEGKEGEEERQEPGPGLHEVREKPHEEEGAPKESRKADQKPSGAGFHGVKGEVEDAKLGEKEEEEHVEEEREEEEEEEEERSKMSPSEQKAWEESSEKKLSKEIESEEEEEEEEEKEEEEGEIPGSHPTSLGIFLLCILFAIAGGLGAFLYWQIYKNSDEHLGYSSIYQHDTYQPPPL